MIKKANQKKKKGFSLIELIIVLAVMAIIALIAIPNFAAVRDNSKVKADVQTCETIERAVLMLVADDAISGNGTFTYDATPASGVEKVVIKASGITKGSTSDTRDLDEIIAEALSEVKDPQAKTTNKSTDGSLGTAAEEGVATMYHITVGTDGSVSAVTVK